jgi:hypothetical protein
VQDIVFMAHTGWRWVVLATLLAAAAIGLSGWNGHRGWSTAAAGLARFAPIAVDIQVLLGLLVYVTGRWWAEDEVFGRYIHPSIMLLALAVIHAASVRMRRTTDDTSRYRWLATGSVLALLIAMAGGALIR